MRIIHLCLLFVVVFVSCTIGKEDNTLGNNANVENLKILRNSVNFAYKAGNEFLNLIRGLIGSHMATEQTYKVLKSENGFKLADILPIYLPFIGYICLALVGLLFIVFVPIVGFCFCCCRCTGKCGGKIKGMDPKHATCKRYTYALFLGIISMIQLAGIVLAFINNQLIHDTLTNPSAEINAVTEFSDGSEMLRGNLRNISEAIEAAKTTPSNKESKKATSDFLNVTCDAYFSVWQNQTGKVNVASALDKILTKLEDTVKYLDNRDAKDEKLQNYTSAFRVEIRNLTSADVRSRLCTIISEVVRSGFTELNGLLQGQGTSGTSTGIKLSQIVTLFNDTVATQLTGLVTKFHKEVKIEYLEYRMYICIGVCCLLLLIVLFYFLGLCFGQCGERPFEDARICNRGVGANLMMAGVAFAFLFTPMIMVLEMGLFMAGGGTQTELCRYFYDLPCSGVGTLDRIIQSIPELANKEFINNSIVDSVINKCPIEPMAVAFKLGNNMITPEINQKVVSICASVRNVPDNTKVNMVDGYFKNIEVLLLNISAAVGNLIERHGSLDQLRSIKSEISAFSLSSVKEKFKNVFNEAAIDGFKPSLNKEVMDTMYRVYLSSYDGVKCNGMATSVRKIVDSVCVTFLWPFNGFWFGIGICLVFTIPAIIFAVKLAGLYRRTEKYSADYEEPDYHSYMGFYTNNADNIPMKRPKSAKSNQKNRNSNPNNKDSVKQNNPQYLPVYPYDAYE